MPRRGEEKAKKAAKGKGALNLGRAIARQQFGASAGTAHAELETERGKHKLRSVTQCDDLEELMSEATLMGKDFAARRGETVLLGSTARASKPAEMAASVADAPELPVPRRPVWTPGQTAAHLEEAERASFLAWRRGLAQLEEEQRVLLTPFEKNLEVWRQLWRVMERSQLLVQIVDARNPLLFRSADLERYAAQLQPPTPCVLLVNKADLLSTPQRAAWASYFTEQRIDFIFWSAAAAQAELDDELRADKLDAAAAGTKLVANRIEDERHRLARQGGRAVDGSEAEPAGGGVGGAEADADGRVPDGGEAEGDGGGGLSSGGDGASAASAAAARGAPTTAILGREQLLGLLRQRCPEGATAADGTRVRTIGLVGYPNVGKSSTVNVLVAEKKTSVSATPGKTKHFQTLHVPDMRGLLLCDCPGLVFPSVAGSKAQMLCDGVLPIDQMRDYIAPVRLLCSRLSPDDLLQAYGVRLRSDEEREEDPDAPELARELLIAHAISRGFMTATKGGPDESRSARIILKDLVNAKLLHCTPPPEGASAAFTGPRASAGARKPPAQPTASRYLQKVKADYEAQEHTGACFSGRKGTAALGTPRGVQWRGAESAQPDRLVATGPKPAVPIEHSA